MSKEKTFQEFLAHQVPEVNLTDFAISLALAAALGFVLKKVFEKYSHVQGNRDIIGRNFILVMMATTMIISVVKSSLALSLGLVGALSIVRFRTAIKEPEELSYLFVAIAVGLGLGADQRFLSTLGFVLIVCVMVVISLRKGGGSAGKYFQILISAKTTKDEQIKKWIETVETFSKQVQIKRMTQSTDQVEVLCGISLTANQGVDLMAQINKADPQAQVRLMEPLEIG